MTLKEFVKKYGSQRAAANKILCTQETINRLLNGWHNQKPSPLMLLRFKTLGITWADPKTPVIPAK